MVIARIPDGSLLLGVSAENLRRLQAGDAIRVSERTHGVPLPPEMPNIYIEFGETEQDIADLWVARARGVN